MDNLGSHFLYPAELYASKEPFQINTILGSCVAVCLWDRTLNYGGMCHYMLPYWNGEGLASPKYGNIAIEKLLEKMYSFGCNKMNIVAKVFGGGEVIETKSPQFHIGERNIKLALEVLEEKKISIISSSLGGKQGRKIIFYTHTGEVKQRYVQRQTVNPDNKN
ncbi:MAG: chemotaxis protein CheD [Bacteroidetes bacterium GWC2_33_15]|nr:MAG: chemotaxis protein CheD [Bacteroidetes bacterium GWA2_33_15]OFX52172.1 MAG: chemotaxis protein CheD [Bacteroidetes bacterium GWC2_33_15]OFX64326.1 MAG: chemotaxis protein CheD [Bacteroidetes bacterium GWB2_32_14]OFX67731.1 MAG: chemotaxis protein CheD [Bacteroidetes bacterium GWD2_33_33]HAN19342.1 chemotaxis protein CheD [Bacteroidales bacterium]